MASWFQTFGDRANENVQHNEASGSGQQGIPTNPAVNRATTPLPRTPGNGTSGR